MKEFEDYLKTVTLYSERERAVADSAFRYALALANTWYLMDTAPTKTTRIRLSYKGKENAVNFKLENETNWIINNIRVVIEGDQHKDYYWQPIPEYNHK